MNYRLTNQVGAHESHGQLVVVLVVNAPQGVLVGLVVLPEPGKGNFAGLLVGILALPVIEDESGLGQGLERVLGLGSFRLGLVIIVISSRLSSRRLGGSRGLGILLGRGVLDGLLNEDRLLNNGLPHWLVDHGLVPTGHVGVFRAPRLVQGVLEATGDLRSEEKIGQSDALTNQEGVDEEVAFEDSESLRSESLGIFHTLLVVGILSDQRAEPATEGREDFGVRERHPTDDRGTVSGSICGRAIRRAHGWNCIRMLQGRTYCSEVSDGQRQEQKTHLILLCLPQ